MKKNNLNQEVLPAKNRRLKVLIAPLDWGLGHTTRCIPLAQTFIQLGVTVFFAGNATQKRVLLQQFPGSPFLDLEGYNIQYSKTARGLVWKLAIQLGSIKKSITAEHAWLLQQCKEHAFDAIISDNRYGLWHPHITSIFITHQLTIKTPFNWIQRLVQKANYRFINRFSACWVPDRPGVQNLAGLLSHPSVLPAVPVSYLGVLSRLKPLQVQREKNHLFISLSGPEPQRSLLETSMLEQLSAYAGSITIVRGVPNGAVLPPVASHITMYNHLDTDAYNREICRAGMVVSRTGYSTVMDIVTAQQKSILIPTPGQTEQEYLASYLTKKGIALCYRQEHFDLLKALKTAETFPYQFFADTPLYETVITGFMQQMTDKTQ